GVKDGRWHTEAEEKFATAYERYLQNGKAPTSVLQEIFDKFRAWMTELYQQLTGVKVSPAVEAIFDRLHGDKLEAQYNERQKAAAEIQAMQ
ncbi:hypothetical protein ABTM08_19790, partial [Acinetobacter baumannii]